MADFKKLIDNKAESAQYMIDGITDVIKKCGKRGPGSEGEKKSCEYMADVLKNECGCERADVESFKEHPHSFLGWLNYTITCALLGMLCFFFLPALGVALFAVGFLIMICQFVLYKKTFDFLFPEETGHNVTAIKKCTGEVKARIFFNGHPDAAWNWPVNNKFGGAVYELHIGSSFLGAFIALVLAIVATAVLGSQGIAYMSDFSLDAYTAVYGDALFWCGIAQLVFVPGLIGMYFMWDPKTTVDGANDNLTGCYMGIAIRREGVGGTAQGRVRRRAHLDLFLRHHTRQQVPRRQLPRPQRHRQGGQRGQRHLHGERERARHPLQQDVGASLRRRDGFRGVRAGRL